MFLDWEKAFHKIDQEMMLCALHRLAVPQKVINVIECMYEDPKFRVRDREGTSSWRRQRAGIRQGCPLSPYLFVVDSKIAGHQWYPFNQWEMLYADDTVLVGKREREINIMMRHIEKECAKYNRKLNYKKCNYIAMNGKASIRFKDGTEMQEVESAVYLGGTVNSEGRERKSYKTG